MSQQQPEYMQEEEREAERLALAAGLGISAWRDFLSMARANILRDRAVEQPTPEAEVSERSEEITSIAFETDADRGYTARASYLKEPRDEALVEIFKDGTFVRSFHFPAYKIWNIAAHFSDLVDSEIEQSAEVSVSPAIEEATARPWKTGTTGDNDLWIEGPNPRESVIADIVSRKPDGLTAEDEANADLIVEAVNAFDSHKAKVERLEDGADEWAAVRGSRDTSPTIAIANQNDPRRAEADMELIVTAVNTHSALVEAARLALSVIENLPPTEMSETMAVEKLTAALALTNSPDQKEAK